MNLTEMRARVRQDLKDTDAANYIWTDAEVDQLIDGITTIAGVKVVLKGLCARLIKKGLLP